MDQEKADSILAVEAPVDLNVLAEAWAQYEEGNGVKDTDLSVFLRVFTLLENALAVLIKEEGYAGFYTVYFRWVAQEQGRLVSIGYARGGHFLRIVNEMKALRNEPLISLAMVG
jgi:hypothetical protein